MSAYSPDPRDLEAAGAAEAARDPLLARAARYARWDGTQTIPALDADEILNALADDVMAEGDLADEDWGAAVAGAADGLAGALGRDEEPAPPAPGEPVPAPGTAADGPNVFVVLLALAAVAVGGWMLWNRWLAGRAAEEDDRERERRLRGLAQRSNALLIETDELLRHNAQELGFVEAEFGAEAAEPFGAALASARGELQDAFRLRQLLDDGTPEEPAEREGMLSEIMARCGAAQKLVGEQTARFQELRDLERRAPEVLAEQERRVADTSGRLPQVEATLDTLRTEASGSSQAVHGNVAEARKRIELASRAASDGQQALQRGDGGSAARAAKASQDALAQANALLGAVDHEAATLAEARSGLDAAVERARGDVHAARSAVGSVPETDQRDELAGALSKLEAADAALRGAPRDLVLAYRLAREAESEAEEVAAKVREAEERRAHQLAAVDAAIRAGELSADRAEEFIAGRHHGIGRRARTALSEADAALERARMLRDDDTAAALADARRATELADAAYERARRDFDVTIGRGRGGTVVIGGQPFPTGSDANWGSDVGGAIIGGIIGSILSGGGRGGGGGFGGFGGGGFGGGGGGGRTFGGGFGGGGGGGRSRGGGW